MDSNSRQGERQILTTRAVRLLATAAVLGLPHAIHAQRAPAPPPADLIVTNARIYTVDESHPFVAAMAVRDGKIQFVGSVREAMLFRGTSTKVLDPQDAPSSREWWTRTRTSSGSANFFATSTSPTRDRSTRSSRASRPALLSTPSGRWIEGRGWDQNKWGDTRFPTHDALSRLSPNNPVVLTRVDGHAILANAAAMRAAGVTAGTKDPAGGRIERSATASRRACSWTTPWASSSASIPGMSHEEMRSATLAAIAEANRWGLVGVHDAGEPRDVLDVFEELAKAGKFNLRVYAMIGDDSAAIAHYFQRGPQSGAVRQQVLDSRDQALRGRRARLARRRAARPLRRRPKNTGLLRSAPDHLRDVSTRALRQRLPGATHAIGDRGNRVVLDAYEAALKAVPTADHRFRIEHVQVLDHADVPRFAQLGVIPSMQAVHQTSDMYWASTRLGYARTLGAYAWRSLLNTGVIIPNGSDFPVERVNPLYSFHAARIAPGRKQLAAGRMVPRTADDPRRGAQVDDDLAGLRRVSGADDGLADSRKAG